MKSFVLGTIFGIVLCTVGLSGIAKMFDNGVSKVQQVTKEAAQ
jgi:flagellar biosynthesis protein FliR